MNFKLNALTQPSFIISLPLTVSSLKKPKSNPNKLKKIYKIKQFIFFILSNANGVLLVKQFIIKHKSQYYKVDIKISVICN